MDVLDRGAAICAVSGGLLWSAFCVYTATLPRGCVGEECSIRSMRDSDTLSDLLFLAGAVLLIIAGIGLVVRLRRRGRLGRVGLVGLGAVVAGVGSLAVGGLLAALVYGPDFEAMPAFVIPGVILVVVGVVLLAVAVLRSGILPRWAGVSLMVAAALLLLANDQTAAVLFGLPFGIAWILVGVAQLRRNAVIEPAT